MQRHTAVAAHLATGLLFATGLLLAGAPAAAQTWTPPDDVQTAAAGDESEAALIEELRKLIDRGEKERLADPWFLRDLRALLDRYDWPWRQQILSEDFSGRGPQPPAPWKVTAGEFLIDWRFGMRSVVEPPRQREAPKEAKTESKGDSVEALLGALIKKQLGDQGKSDEPAAEPERDQPSYAAVIAPVKISNAFALEMEITSRAVQGLTDGRLELGPYQGEQANAGYRLAYTPNPSQGAPSWELLKLSSRGTSTLELYDKDFRLEDEQAHKLVWTRDRDGAMVIGVDGKELFRATDRSFRDPFVGFAIVNSGGDVAVRRIVIDGTDK